MYPEEHQGLRMDCILCTVINEEVDPNCPECKGAKTYFQPARMMDRQTSSMDIFDSIVQVFGKEELDLMSMNKDEIYELLKKVMIYHFDIKRTLIEMYKELESMD
ncbi:MAG: hypothetical protein ACXAE3_09845 [Candidatus Kariarchaeaceae archaeon]|jgi:hypothetical protein